MSSLLSMILQVIGIYMDINVLRLISQFNIYLGSRGIQNSTTKALTFVFMRVLESTVVTAVADSVVVFFN